MCKHIKHTLGNDLYSMQQFNGVLSLSNFPADNIFTKWAAVDDEQSIDVAEK